MCGNYKDIFEQKQLFKQYNRNFWEMIKRRFASPNSSYEEITTRNPTLGCLDHKTEILIQSLQLLQKWKRNRTWRFYWMMPEKLEEYRPKVR